MYVELRARSAFSFLQAASLPEELAERAAELGYKAIALADADGVYGIPRFVKAARAAGVRPIVGASVSVADLEGRIVLLCENAQGWQGLCELLTEAHHGGGKVTLEQLERLREGLVALVGGPDGPLLCAATARGTAAQAARRLMQVLGSGRVFVDIQRHGERREEYGCRLLRDMADALHLPVIATNDVRYHRKERGRVLDALSAIREGVTLDQAGRRLSVAHRAFLASPEEMASRFERPLLMATEALAERLQYAFVSNGYSFPRYPVPEGETEFGVLKELVWRGVRERYRTVSSRVRSQVEHELETICKLELAGYFLVVWDIVRFCKENNILAQGRGSAANSVVCYSLGITAIDPIAFDLLFERFLSEERGEWPDIDLDLPSGEDRERVIQYVYERYGRRSVGMTASVITYQPRLAARELGKVFGLNQSSVERLAHMLHHFGPKDDLKTRMREAGFDTEAPSVVRFMEVFDQLIDLPRHLSQHNGGLVIAGGRLDWVVPLQPAAMPGRTMVQWDKDDLADLRIIKVDLLGLGMLAAIDDTLRLVRQHEGVEVDLAHLPPDDPDVYDMLNRADTVGVFQVESRAQMATLPRMKPKCFYDLVVEVAIIRPGPIVGKMVHPYLRRRAGLEQVRYAHPDLEPILARTLGIPLFQEQVMRMAMAVAGFTGGQAEELRRALGSRRSRARMERMIQALREGMIRRGVSPDAQEEIVSSIASFALYGFPESHAASFALIAYASAWLKVHHPAAFYCALLNRWPMGFYHPATLVKDAERHGVATRPVDVTVSSWDCTLEPAGTALAIRLGLKYVKGLSRRTGDAIVAERAKAPFVGVADLGRRTQANQGELLALAQVGAMDSLSQAGRRDALWRALGAFGARGLLAGTEQEVPEPGLRPMTGEEEVLADYDGLGLTTGPHPFAFMRGRLAGFSRAAQLATIADGSIVKVAGIVVVRQRPKTAKGFYFATLEDETGLANVVVAPDLFEANRAVLTNESFVGFEGRLQRRDGVVSVKAMRIIPLHGPFRYHSRDFV